MSLQSDVGPTASDADAKCGLGEFADYRMLEPTAAQASH
jgi:hypothetical protein